MNRDQTQGQWHKIKGRAKEIWGDLTDDDFTRADGSAERLYGIIQKKFGDTREEIQRRMDERAY